MLLAVILVVNGFWLGPMQIDGFASECARAERVSVLEARLIAIPLTEREFVLGNRLV